MPVQITQQFPAIANLCKACTDYFSSVPCYIFAPRLVCLLFVKRALYPVNVIGEVFTRRGFLTLLLNPRLVRRAVES